MAPKILIVLTSYGKIEGTDHTTGWYLPELAHPYDVLSPKAELVFASPKGGEAPLDAGSVELFKEDPSSVNFVNTKQDLWKKTAKLSDFLGKTSEFDAIFYPGGHGPMFDLATDKDSIALIREFVEAGKPVAAVCHGPAVFVNVKLADGSYLLAGKEATGFSNLEEDQVKMTPLMPFLLEDQIKEKGGIYKKAAEPWAELVLSVDGGKFITGQNPASAKGVGEALAKSLGI